MTPLDAMKQALEALEEAMSYMEAPTSVQPYVQTSVAITNLRRLFLRWHYGYEKVNAYLAEQMGEMDVAANHDLVADRVWLKWWREKHN